MSELAKRLENSAVEALNTGKWLLCAALCRALAELEMETAIADVNGDTAWNGRTVPIPLQTRTGQGRGRRQNETEAVCGACGTRVFVEMHNVGIRPGDQTAVPGMARHENPSLDVDHRVRLKA